MTVLGEIERQDVRDRGVLRFITAGSVDDGKSTLIGRLLHDSRAILADQLAAVARASSKRGNATLDLSLLTDGLEAEREQGITIDVAYRYFATRERKFIIADTPGHEQYTRNMATGASTADAAIILVDARKGVLAQTRRHTCIAHLLGVRHIVVAVNKMDLVGYDEAAFERIRTGCQAFAADFGIPDLRFVPISALAGDMVVERGEALPWYRGPTLLELLESLEPADEAASLPARFPVQWVIRPGAGNDFRGYAGRLESGVLLPGSEVVVLPSGRRTHVSGILMLEDARDIAVAGDSVTLTLTDDIDVSRGDLIAAAHAAPTAVKAVEARLCWLDTAPLDAARKYLLKHTTRTVRAKIDAIVDRVDIHSLARVPTTAVALNDIAHVRLTLAHPIACDPYAANRATGAFILIDEATNQTVAAGMIE